MDDWLVYCDSQSFVCSAYTQMIVSKDSIETTHASTSVNRLLRNSRREPGQKQHLRAKNAAACLPALQRLTMHAP